MEPVKKEACEDRYFCIAVRLPYVLYRVKRFIIGGRVFREHNAGMLQDDGIAAWRKVNYILFG